MQKPLIGNLRICNMLNSMIKNRRIPHAILIEGEEGLGKKTLAKYIAKACLCAQNEAPCLNCKSCHLIDVGSHPDFLVISPDGNAIKVDQIRSLRSEAYLLPLMSTGRVFVIDFAHTMNASAQNALLKVLEEPPTGVHFILLAKSASLLLETIRSRCVCFTLSPVSPEEESFNLVANKADIPVSKAEELLLASDGNIGKAIVLADGENNFLSSVANEIITLAALNDKFKILNALQPYVKERRLVAELIAEIKNAVSNEMKKKAMREYTSFTAERLNYCYEELTEVEKTLVFNPSVPLIFCRVAALLTDR